MTGVSKKVRSQVVLRKITSAMLCGVYVVSNIVPVSVLVAGVGFVGQLSQTAEASVQQEDNNGTWTLDFKDNSLGYITGSSITDSSSNPVTQDIVQDSITGKIAPSSKTAGGQFTTTDIRPGSADAWEKITLNGQFDRSKIQVNLFECGGNPLTSIS